MNEETIMTKQDVMEYLHACRGTVDKLFLMPGFPKIMIGKKKAVVKYGDLCRYLDLFVRNTIPINQTERTERKGG